MIGRRLECCWIRGGTSKGLFFNNDTFPFPRHSPERDTVVRNALGFGGNGMQLDGIGGGISSTSKVAFVGTSLVRGTDLTYDFGKLLIYNTTRLWQLVCDGERVW
jgi:2-methylaconitate cis-trans-isomerase PrpF